MNADEYGRMYALEDAYWWFVGRRSLALSLLDRALSGRTAPIILDVGCGTGVVLRELQSRGRAIGADMSRIALEFCRKRGLGRLIQADGIRLPIQTGAVEAIVALDIFEHIEDDEQAFREAYRALSPGGVLVLSVPAFKFLWGPHDIALMHFRRYRAPELRAKLQAAGFRVEHLSYSVFLLFPIVVVVRFFEKRRKGPARASLTPLPRWANQALIGVQALEAELIRRFSLPWGSSLVAVAVKP